MTRTIWLLTLMIGFLVSSPALAVKTAYCEFFCSDGDGRLVMWKQRSLIHDGTAADRGRQIKTSLEDFCGKLVPRSVCKDHEPQNTKAELEKMLCTSGGVPGASVDSPTTPETGRR